MLVGFPLGAFLLMFMLQAWLLSGQRKLVLCGWTGGLPVVALLWSDGSKVTNEVALVDGAGAGSFARISEDACIRRKWRHMEPLTQGMGAAVDR